RKICRPAGDRSPEAVRLHPLGLEPAVGGWPGMARRSSPSGGAAVAVASRTLLASCGLEHDPEKWAPVFGKDHAPAISWSGMTIRRTVIPLYASAFPGISGIVLCSSWERHGSCGSRLGSSHQVQRED